MKNLILILLIVNSLFAGWMNVDSMNVKQKWRNKKLNTDALLYVKDSDSLLDTCNIYFKSGLIGINTSSPSVELTVDGTGYITNGLQVEHYTTLDTLDVLNMAYISDSLLLGDGTYRLKLNHQKDAPITSTNYSMISTVVDAFTGLNGGSLILQPASSTADKSIAFFGGTTAKMTAEILDTTIYKILTDSTYLYGITGVGTVPTNSAMLDVNSGIMDQVAYFQSTDVNAKIVLKDNTSTQYLATQNSLLSLGANGSYGGFSGNLNIDATGQIGIGTVSLNHKLTVQNPINDATAIAQFKTDPISVSNHIARIDLRGTYGAGSAGGAIYLTDSVYPCYIKGIRDGSLTSSKLYFGTNSGGGSSVTDHMTIDGDGNISFETGKVTLEEEGIVLNRTGGGGYFNFQDGSAVNNWQIAHTNTDNKLSFWSSTIDGILNIGKVKTGTMFHLNTNNGRIGMGTDAADGNLHVFTATAGTITPSGSADEIIIENSTNAGMTILSPDANYSSVFFGSPSHSAGGAISWKYDDKKLLISTTTDGKTVFRYDDNIEAMRINDEGHLGIGDSTPGAKLTIAEGPDTIKIEAAQWGCVAYTSGQFAGGVSDPDMAAVGGTSLYQPHFAGLASLEEVHGTMKVPADALSGDTLFFSTRAAPATTGAGNYTLHFYYSVINNTGTTTITSIDDSLIATTAASGTAYEFTIIELGYITGLEPNECLLFRFFRDPADATDTYGADVCCIGAGFKYRIASLGQITK